MERPLDLIEVIATAEEAIPADQVHLHVSLEGSSLFTGEAALKQGREVGELIQRLEARAVPDSSVHLEGLEARISSKLLGKSSSAVYQLRIELEELAKLGDVLQVLVGMKNIELQSLEWQYTQRSAAEQRLLGKCVGVAREKAQAAAHALGLSLGPVHRVVEMPPPGPMRGIEAAGAEPQAFVRRRTSEEFSLEAAHSLHLTKAARLLFHLEPPGSGGRSPE